MSERAFYGLVAIGAIGCFMAALLLILIYGPKESARPRVRRISRLKLTCAQSIDARIQWQARSHPQDRHDPEQAAPETAAQVPGGVRD